MQRKPRRREGHPWDCTTDTGSGRRTGIANWGPTPWRATSCWRWRCSTPSHVRLLKRFRSLQGVLQATPEELEREEGVGRSAALLLCLIGDISRRARITSLPEKILNSPDRTGAYFMELLTGQKRELLYQVCLDGKGKLLTCRCIGKGTVSASPVHVRQVVENALYAGASTIILAHNHPSGVALPSDADVLVTRRIQEALAPLGIRLADHIIVADDDYVSMAESGFLQR